MNNDFEKWIKHFKSEKPGAFASGLTVTEFESIVSSLDMKIVGYKKISMDGINYILQEWKDKTGYVGLNKIMEFSSESLSLMDSTQRKDLLTHLMQECVENEEYEKAALYRDMIKEFE